MTLRVARIYFGLAVLALLGGLAWWATGRDRAWGLLLWALTVLLVAVPFLVAGVPHSGSITTTEYGTGRLMTDHYEQPGRGAGCRSAWPTCCWPPSGSSS
jgi:hypothetical protein